MSILKKIALESKEHVAESIVKKYIHDGSVIVSFLYFTNLMKGRLLEGTPMLRQQEYLHALQRSDFLLADGIALQTFIRWSSWGRKHEIYPPNLNGTDFNPYFFDYLFDRHSNVNVCLLMFWDTKIGKGEEYGEIASVAFRERFGSSLSYVWQTQYQNKECFKFDRDAYEKTLDPSDEVRVLFVCLGTPTQEIWIERNRKKIEQYKCIVLNAGGTIDYITGFEKRAPQRVVKARVLETFRRVCSHPKKNLKKFLEMFGIVRYRWYCFKQRLTHT